MDKTCNICLTDMEVLTDGVWYSGPIFHDCSVSEEASLPQAVCFLSPVWRL